MRWLIVIAVIAIIVAIYLSGDSSTPTNLQPVTPSTMQATAPEPDAEPAPPPRQPVQAAPDKLQQIKQIAQIHRVQIVNYQPMGNGALIHLQWGGDSTGPGGDLINDLLTKGIIRGANDPQQGVGMDRQQRRVYWTKWQLVF
jgi:hypothetical protein